MNVEARERHGITYYYLAHSYRRFGKVRKARIYLGRDLTEAELEKKRSASAARLEAQLARLREIRDPYKTALTAEELDGIKSLIPAGKIRLTHLSEEDWLRFTEAFTYDTNAIEGSTVEQRDVARIIEKNEWPDKSKGEISETLGVAEAVAYVRKTGEHLSIQLIKDLHRIVFKNSKDFAGDFRKPGEDVAVIDASHKVIHRGAPPSSILPLLKELVRWYEENRGRYPPLVLASVVHNQFEGIHPFRDGNGRIGRLLLINILLKHRLPPVNIELKSRTEYYEALRAYERNSDIRPTIELLLKEYGILRRKLSM